MSPYVISGIIGAVLMGRTKPKTRIKTETCFGPRTGVTYTVDILPGNSVVIVHAPDGTAALFHRGITGRYGLLQGLKGQEATVKVMQKDFEP